MAEVVQVSRLLDQRGLTSFHYNLIFWCVLLSLIDGYDIAAIAFAAPHRCVNGGSSLARWARSSAQA
jgi:hypothetical protein